jgi:type III restriction enzyme
MPTVIDELVINSPYEEPSEYWRYDRDRFEFKREQSRRPSGYMVASKAATTEQDPGDFVEMPLVNRIRKRVGNWRDAGWPGATGVTRRRLEHWWDKDERETRQFFSVNWRRRRR